MLFHINAAERFGTRQTFESLHLHWTGHRYMTMVMTSHRSSRIIKASEFKAKCLALIDQVADTGDPIVITNTVSTSE